MAIKAIETQYAGCRFRSRLEARWAVFFDTLGVQWEYEPQGFETPDGPYLPDFYLPVGKVWVEIKGASPSQNDLDRCRHIPGLVLLVGDVPRTIEDWTWEIDHSDWGWYYPYPTGWPFGGVRPPGDVVDGALTAARSARFEHGKSPSIRKTGPPTLQEVALQIQRERQLLRDRGLLSKDACCERAETCDHVWCDECGRWGRDNGGVYWAQNGDLFPNGTSYLNCGHSFGTPGRMADMRWISGGWQT